MASTERLVGKPDRVGDDMTLVSLEVQDVERDYTPVDLSSFDAETVVEWSQYFLKDYAKWPPMQAKPSQLCCTMCADGQLYLVTARFHSPESFAAFLLSA